MTIWEQLWEMSWLRDPRGSLDYLNCWNLRHHLKVVTGQQITLLLRDNSSIVFFFWKNEYVCVFMSVSASVHSCAYEEKIKSKRDRVILYYLSNSPDWWKLLYFSLRSFYNNYQWKCRNSCLARTSGNLRDILRPRLIIATAFLLLSILGDT